MSGSLSLNGTWGLAWAEGSMLVPPQHYMGPELKGQRTMPARVPAPIHQVLKDVGLIEDVNIGLNSLKARWVEEMVWVYRHILTVSEETADQNAWLIFEKLELEAVVLLNGQEVGRHANANRPARFDVTGKLRAGENLLIVRLSTGMHSASDKPGGIYSAAETDLLTKRPWLRKPQYQCGWDWNPRLVNVGILGDVRLEWRSVPRLDGVTVFAVPSEDLSAATLTVRATVEGIEETPVAGTLRARIADTGQEVSLPVSISAGASRYELKIEIAAPRLWWPVHHGEQFRYTVEITLESGGESQTAIRKTGVRKVEIDQPPHPVEGRYFILKINNRPIFCKGGNWVPADMLYSAVTEERYRKLVRLALEANFNTLRVWGGGLFADHALLDACDEAGILVWHDFLFACSKYPGQDAGFAEEVRQEVTYAVRDMAHHPSLAVWCGNNEIEWGDCEWYPLTNTPYRPHHALFAYEIPKIVHAEDPSKPYWFSSPYSPDNKAPNDPIVGDQHPWNVSIATPGGADWWNYRRFVDRFPNEGGVLGASSPATLRQILPEGQRYLYSPAWTHHDNPFACTDSPQGSLGHAYETVLLWTGRNPLEIAWEDYAFLSALLQAEGLQEYISNYRRRMFSSASAIFWMYNDSWPVTHGWTIVDYYLRKKLSYHPVRRAFQPVTVVVAEEAGTVTVYGINDTPQEWSGDLRSGIFTLAGGLPYDESRPITLPANASTPLARFNRARWEEMGLRQSGAFVLLLEEGRPIAQHRLFLERFNDLAFVEPHIDLKTEGDTLTLTCDTFAWGVCLDVDGEMSLADNCFDLLPGIPHQMPWDSGLGEAQVVRVGNELVR